jgi:lipoprotein-anchoring transpeptidase ErfK/SrfK
MDVRIALLSVLVLAVLGLVMVSDHFPTLRRDAGAVPVPATEISVVPTPTMEKRAYETPKPREVAEIFVSTPAAVEEPPIAPAEPAASAAMTYIEVTGGCSPHWAGACLNVRSGPGTAYPSIYKLRNGTVLKSAGVVDGDGMRWHRIVFDEWLRYPERVNGEWYIAADYVRSVMDPGPIELTSDHATTSKRILVDRSDQKLYAYDGDALFMEEPISTGLDLTPTPRGTFTVFRKTPSRYMQGPLQGISDDFYDLPGVPWNLYFTEAGGAIHGTYWHENFGRQWSHGCVNLPPEKAQALYAWAPVGTTVVVRD